MKHHMLLMPIGRSAYMAVCLECGWDGPIRGLAEDEDGAALAQHDADRHEERGGDGEQSAARS